MAVFRLTWLVYCILILFNKFNEILGCTQPRLTGWSNMTRKNFFCVLAIWMAFAVLTGPAIAQEVTGTVSGTVTDGSGGVVPDATVTVTSTRTSSARSTVSTSAGIFFFNNLPVGDYQLSVEKNGFEKYQLNSIQLHVDDKLNFNVVLKVGGRSEQITVSAQASQLQTETAEVSNLIGTKQMLALPLNGRSFNQLVDLVPGVSPDNGTVQSGTGLNSDTSISVDGGLSNSNMFLVDGEYDLDSGGNGNLLVTPSVDAIEEFKILNIPWERVRVPPQ
jgi:hypothetical protein